MPNYDVAIRGIEKALKSYLDIQSDRQRIMGDVFINQMKANNNWLYKLNEMKAQKDMEWESKKREYDYFKSQGQGGGDFQPENFLTSLMPEGVKTAQEETGMQETPMGPAPTATPMRSEIDMASLANPANRMRTEMGASGPLRKSVSIADALYNVILNIEKRRPLTPGEQKKKADYETKMFGGGTKPVDMTAKKIQLKRLAQQEAYRQMGGSMMVGLSETKKKQYAELADSLYQGYLKELKIDDTQQPEIIEPTEENNEQPEEVDILDTNW